MSIYLVGYGAPARLRLRPVAPFEATARVRGDLRALPATVRGILDCERVACQKGAARSGSDCLTCARYRGLALAPDGSHASLECAWTDRDPVWARMTTSRVLASVGPRASVAAAEAVARAHAVRHLPVLEAGRLAGILCRCDLVVAPPEAPVAAHMTREVFALRAGATLGEALAAMTSLRVGVLPVIGDRLIVGMISRGDLRRVGVPEERLGASRCARCDSPRGVRRHPRRPDVDECLECLEREGVRPR
jgi:CBS-domain-containing membrane protein